MYRESFAVLEVTDDTRLLYNRFRLRDAITAQDPHLDRQRETQAAQTDIQYKDQGTQFPQNPRAMEQYATNTEAPSRTVLLHVVQVKVIAPSGSSLTTYALLDNASRGTIISKITVKRTVWVSKDCHSLCA